MSRPIERTPGRKEAGFTMPELLVVIVVTGILITISAASWHNVTQGRRADSAANQVLSDLRLAHTSATNQLADWRLVYRSGASVPCGAATAAAYCLVKLDTAGNVLQTVPRTLPGGSEISATTVADDTTILLLGGTNLFPGTKKSVRFDPDGSAQAVGGLVSGAARPEMTVGFGGGGPSRVLSVTTATSRIKVD